MKMRKFDHIYIINYKKTNNINKMLKLLILYKRVPIVITMNG